MNGGPSISVASYMQQLIFLFLIASLLINGLHDTYSLSRLLQNKNARSDKNQTVAICNAPFSRNTLRGRRGIFFKISLLEIQLLTHTTHGYIHYTYI